MLPSILAMYPSVRLVVLDSITFHFRHDFEGNADFHRPSIMQRARPSLASYFLLLLSHTDTHTRPPSLSLSPILVCIMSVSYSSRLTDLILHSPLLSLSLS